MNSSEWLGSKSPEEMLDWLAEQLDDRVSERKLRLFTCATKYAIWHLMNDNERSLTRLFEAFADGQASKTALYVAIVGREPTEEPEFYPYTVCDAMDDSWATAQRSGDPESAFPSQASFLRDIFGNPFLPIAAAPAWQTSTVVGLAKTIYDERRFDRMAGLADELCRAGCPNPEILEHCHQAADHVRGCWVVDLLLAKS
jgi:hypothetical protein